MPRESTILPDIDEIGSAVIHHLVHAPGRTETRWLASASVKCRFVIPTEYSPGGTFRFMADSLLIPCQEYPGPVSCSLKSASVIEFDFTSTLMVAGFSWATLSRNSCTQV